MSFKELQNLNPKALDFMRSELVNSLEFQELDAVEKLNALNLIIDGIVLYLEGVAREIATLNIDNKVH